MRKHTRAPNLAPIGVLSFAVLITSFTLVAAKTPTITSYTNRQVLGDETTSEADKKAAEQAQEQQKQAQEQQQKQAEQRSPEPNTGVSGGGSVNIQAEGQKRELEIQKTGQKLKMKIEDNGNAKIEAEKPTAKFKIEIQDSKVDVKTEDKNGDLIDASQKEHEQVEDFLKENDIGIASEDGRMKIERHGVEAHTQFPLSVDPVSKALVVTTPAGQKSVTVLPDQAVQNMLSGGVISTVASGSAVGAQVPTGVGLEMRDGNLVYRIEGQKDLRLFGLIPVTTATTAFVSPENGQIIAQQQSLLASILRFFSR